MVSGRESILAQEVIGANEAEMIKSIVEANIKTHSVKEGIAQRGQHAKHHACVAARFKILDGLSDEYRVGIFSQPRSYNALIRFSNGSTNDDRKADAHGMAIKVLSVTGDRALDNESFLSDQDFVLVDQPVFFSKTLAEYEGFGEHATKIIDFRKNKWRLGGLPRRLIGLITGSIMLLLQFRETLGRVQTFTSGRPNSPLTTTYWSTTPYLFGDGKAVKYMALSTRTDFVDRDAGPKDANQLAATLKSDLDKGRVIFKFGVQLQTDPDAHPIEDTTKDWGPYKERFVPLAEIVINKQQPKHEHDLAWLADRLEYSPWHALAVHRPLGAINRSRKAVYLKMAELRRNANGNQPAAMEAVIQRIFRVEQVKETPQSLNAENMKSLY